MKSGRKSRRVGAVKASGALFNVQTANGGFLPFPKVARNGSAGREAVVGRRGKTGRKAVPLVAATVARKAGIG